MFLDHRSPVRVKVTSKKTEVFFLKKMDVMKIASDYQNIWKRIIKKSIFNFEQIKKSIPKIVKLYCRSKGINLNIFDENTTHKLSNKNLNKIATLPSTNLKIRTLTLKKPKRSSTQRYNKRKIFDKYFPNKDDYSYKSKNNITHVKMNLHKNILNNSDDSNNNDDYNESSESSIISDNTNSSKFLSNNKLSNIYNKNNKYYIGYKLVKNSDKKKRAIIKEKLQNNSPLKESNIKKNLGEIKNSNKSNNNINENSINNNLNEKRTFSNEMFDNKNKNEINSKAKKKNKEITNENNKEIHDGVNNILPEVESIKRKKSNIIEELLANENENNKYSINDEFNINEEIKIPRNDSLMNRSIIESILMKEKSDISIQKISNLSNQNSIKHLDLNKSKDSNILGAVRDKNNYHVNNNKLVNYKKTFENDSLIPDNIIKNFQINSIYINLHSINNKYHLNKKLQKIVKQLLEENIEVIYKSNNISNKSKSISMNQSINKSVNKSVNNININLPRITSLKSSLLLPSIFIQKKKYKQKTRNFYKKRASTYTEPDNKNNNNINYNSETLKKKRKNFGTNIVDFPQSKKILRKQSLNRIGSSIMQNHNDLRGDSTRLGIRTKDNLLSFNKFKSTKRKKSSLLAAINFNIEKGTEYINNPNEFYNSYFRYLIENKKKDGELGINSTDLYSQFKKNKK